MKTFEIIATTLFGLEEVLASELNDLGATDIEILSRAVKYSGDQSLLYKSNLHLRTAVKVLVPIATFIANNEQELYDNIKKIRWDNYMNYKKTFAIDGSCHGEVFTHSMYVALKSKDAIADQFREKFNIRPSVNIDTPDLRIGVHIVENQVTVSLDSSGSSLGKRGYRLHQTLAPINEVLAAGIILLTDWDKQSDFIDPMCGSGTFPIEAALMANNIPAGNLRHFGFETWNDFDASAWNEIKMEAEAKIKTFKGKIIATDIDKKAIEIAVPNAHRAGVMKNITFENIDFLESAHDRGQGLVIMNPPYGERLQVNEIIPFYQNIGSRLKHFYPGCDAWIISGNYDALKYFGLKPSKKIKLFNGPIECRLQKYELYQGSKKQAKQ